MLRKHVIDSIHVIIVPLTHTSVLLLCGFYNELVANPVYLVDSIKCAMCNQPSEGVANLNQYQIQFFQKWPHVVFDEAHMNKQGTKHI